MQELPATADGIAQWCKDVFVTKVGSSMMKICLRLWPSLIHGLVLPNHQDAFLENYRTKDMFGNLPVQDIGRPKKSLLVSLGRSITKL